AGQTSPKQRKSCFNLVSITIIDQHKTTGKRAKRACCSSACPTPALPQKNAVERNHQAIMNTLRGSYTCLCRFRQVHFSKNNEKWHALVTQSCLYSQAGCLSKLLFQRSPICLMKTVKGCVGIVHNGTKQLTGE